MTEEDARRKGLVPGARYRITIEDCCVEATLVGTFLRTEWDDGEPSYVFDIGTIGPHWGRWETTLEEESGQWPE